MASFDIQVFTAQGFRPAPELGPIAAATAAQAELIALLRWREAHGKAQVQVKAVQA